MDERLRRISQKLGLAKRKADVFNRIYDIRKALKVLERQEKEENSGRSLTSIVILAWPPHYQDPFNYLSLISSIRENTESEYEIILVFNSFTNEMVESLEKLPMQESRIKIAFLSENVGVPRGWNIASHIAEGETLVVINEDVIVGPGCIDKLALILKEDRKIGMAGPRGASFRASGGSELLTKIEPEKETTECDVVSGFMFAVRREVFKEAGEVDDFYTPCFFEETDFSLRITALGYRCVIVNGLSYRHAIGASSYKPWKTVDYLGKKEDVKEIAERNEKYFIGKWGRNVR
jgi:GT2 family glycosyltransferase